MSSEIKEKKAEEVQKDTVAQKKSKELQKDA